MKKHITAMTPTSHPSLPNRYRAELCFEYQSNWTAHIKVDYDHGNPLLLKNIRGAVKRQNFYIVRVEVCRTRKGHHLRAWFDSKRPRLPAEEILRLQSVLGDDPKRQRLNARRVARGEAGWNVLWNGKIVNGKDWSVEILDRSLTKKISRILVKS